MVAVMWVALCAIAARGAQWPTMGSLPLTRLPVSTHSSRIIAGVIDGSDDEGYGALGSLVRQGPPPFIQRLTNPEKYENSVQKFMAEEKCSRKEAQGNMDKFLADPDGWQLERIRAKKTGISVNYAEQNMEPKQLILTACWALVVFALAARVVYVYAIPH